MKSQQPFRHFGTMLDCSRNAVMTVKQVEEWIDLTASLGYNTLLLYIEDTYEVDGQPYFGYMRGRYSQEELKHIDDYAAARNMEVIPCIQTLAHLNAIFRWPAYRELRDVDDILLAGDERVYALIESIFATLHKCFRSRTVNIGMDEAHMIGRGQYLDRNGLQDRSGILVDHLARVAKIARGYDMQLIMWGDMFFRMISGGEYYVDHVQVSDEIRSRIPDNVELIYWDYYSTDRDRYERQIRSHKAIKNGVWFAGGLWSWAGFAPHNTYSMQATQAALEACRANGVQDVFLTMWGDNGGECSKFSLLPALYYAAEIAKGNGDMEAIKEGFARQFGIPFDGFMLLDLPGTPNEFAAPANAEKYLLYNDCLMGLMDSTIQPEFADGFAACAQKLRTYESDPRWGYLFYTMRTLCEALAIKTTLGLRTRAAYTAGDKSALAALVPEYTALIEKLEAFYSAYEAQWMHDNKPHGFDVQDARLGGLIRRVTHCRDRVDAYAAGRLDRVEELEEQLLDLFGGGQEFRTGPLRFNRWEENITANVI